MKTAAAAAAIVVCLVSGLCSFAAAQQPREQEPSSVLEREFMIGPRLGLSGAVYSREGNAEPNVPPYLTVELDMKKDLGAFFWQLDVGIMMSFDGEHGALLVDGGFGYYLSPSSPTSLYLGGGAGLRVASGPDKHTALAIGPSAHLSTGVVMNRTASTRFYVDARLGAQFLSYMTGVLGEPAPDPYFRGELTVAAGVGF